MVKSKSINSLKITAMKNIDLSDKGVANYFELVQTLKTNSDINDIKTYLLNGDFHMILKHHIKIKKILLIVKELSFTPDDSPNGRIIRLVIDEKNKFFCQMHSNFECYPTIISKEIEGQNQFPSFLVDIASFLKEGNINYDKFFIVNKENENHLNTPYINESILHEQLRSCGYHIPFGKIVKSKLY